MKNLLTQASTGLEIAPGGGFKGFGPLGNLPEKSDGITIFTSFISKVIGILTIIAIIWFVFTFIAGAIGYMSAGGDKAAVESARKKILNGVIGLVMVIISIFVISLIGTLIGIPDILNITKLFTIVAGQMAN
jgi:hypothetical protein